MKTRLAASLAAAVLAFAGANLAQAAQVSGAVGATSQGDMTYRIGLSFDWDKKWLESSTGYVTGYWDAAYTYWEGGDASGAHSLVLQPGVHLRVQWFYLHAVHRGRYWPGGVFQDRRG